MRKREVLIVIVLILFGIMYKASKDEGLVFVSFPEGCNGDHRSLTDKKYPHDYVQEEIKRVNIKKIQIDNLAGNIVVEKAAADENRVLVQTTICVYNRDKNKADKMAKEIKIVTKAENTPGTTGTAEAPGTPAGANDILKISVESGTGFYYQRARVHFRLVIPQNVELDIRNSYGFIEINDCGKNIVLDENYGDIIARKIDSTLTIRQKNGDATISEIKDTVDISARYSTVDIQNVPILKLRSVNSRISIEDVKIETTIDNATYSNITINNAAKVTIDGRQTEIDLTNIKEGVNVKNSYESISLTDIQGNVTIIGRDCEIEMTNVVSDNVSLHNSYDDITIERLSAKNVDITVNHGKLNMTFDKIEEKLNINNSYSDVNVGYLATVQPVVSVDSLHGSFINNTSVDYPVLKQNDHVIVSPTKTEGKPKIVINTSYGEVRIENTEASEPNAAEKTSNTPGAKAEKESI